MLRGLFGWQLVRVTGDSMVPALDDGDFVITRPGTPAVGDVVLARHPSLGLIIKRVRAANTDRTYALVGDNPISTSTTAIGPVPADRVQGVAVWSISPAGIVRLRRTADDSV